MQAPSAVPNSGWEEIEEDKMKMLTEKSGPNGKRYVKEVQVSH